MTIRRLDVFFRTQLTLDQPQFFNSITNLALAPLQRVVGQNSFQSLKGKVDYVPQITPAGPACYVATLFKVVVFVCNFFVAIVLTPIGIAARYMSFQSPQIDRAYSHAFLLQLDPDKRADFLSLDANAELSEKYLNEITESVYLQLMPHLSLKLIELYKAQKLEKAKKQSLDKHLTTAIESLEKIDTAHKSKKPVFQIRSDLLYPFPFYLAQRLESSSKVVARADKALWERFMTLRQSCLKFLLTDCDDELLKTTQAQANKTLTEAFKPNVNFFNELKKKLDSMVKPSEVQEWVENQRRHTDNYSYPFYTHPSVLKFIGRTAAAEKLRPFSEAHSACLELLRAKDLDEYLNEKPDPHHVAVNALMQAMDRLENISKLQNLINTQTA